jgi:DNA-binding NtrC family response regulator
MPGFRADGGLREPRSVGRGKGIALGALLALDGHDWPGNVRELENIIERSVALATRPVIGLDDLPLDLAMNETVPGRSEGEPGALTLKDARDRFEQAYVPRALEREGWNQSRARAASAAQGAASSARRRPTRRRCACSWPDGRCRQRRR